MKADLIATASDILRSGGLVIFPTETVYGLGADATNPDAIAKVFAAKKRPHSNPLIVHIGSIDEIHAWAIDCQPYVFKLAKAFWPGPLTMVLPKKADVLQSITANSQRVALRMPNHPIALTLLKTFGSGIVGPSANMFTEISPTNAAHTKSLQAIADLILDGGPSNIGIESTVINCKEHSVEILRPGIITALDLNTALQDLPIAVTHSTAITQEKLAPGNFKKHYAPKTPLYLLNYNKLLFDLDLALTNQEKIAVLSFATHPNQPNLLWQQASSNPREYAHALYATLHTFDALKLDKILIEMPPATPEWLSILDRLNKASSNQLY